MPVRSTRLITNKPTKARIDLNTGVLTDDSSSGVNAGENLIEIPNAITQASKENTIFRNPYITPAIAGNATITRIAISTDCTMIRPACF